MEGVCYRCGSEIEAQTSFCASCGAPQIRVSVPESQVLTQPDSSRADPPAEPPPSTAVHPRAGQTSQIHWKGFLRVGAPLAAGVALFTVNSSPLGWLVLLPGSVFFAVHIYRQRHPALLKAAQGVKMGAVIGLINFSVTALVGSAYVAHDPAAYRQEVENQLKDMVAHNPNPQIQQAAQTMLGETSGVALLTVMMLTVVLVFLLVIGGLSGALATVFLRKKSP